MFTAVLMHLVVLGAFGPAIVEHVKAVKAGLNAPCGAGCFRTTLRGSCSGLLTRVLMHLVVLGAFGHPKEYMMELVNLTS